MTFRILDRKLLYKGFTRIEGFDVEQTTRDGRVQRIWREVENHGSGAGVLIYDAGRRVAILVRQLRLPIGLILPERALVLEVAAGLADAPGEDGAETARREAREEVGIELGVVELAVNAFSTPGMSAERLSLYLAEVDLATARISAGGGLVEEQEDIEVVELPLAELARLADCGEIIDLKTFALVQTLRIRRPELFS
ncbi:MAG: NUDIX hydrolase [Ancalomicrobiaceae bacterium]|nr:NUDIX hydrolase [Ancalomicrobiaceae bacterium]